MFRYWMFYGWLIAGRVKKWSFSLSCPLAFCLRRKQKGAQTLSLLRGGCSIACCEVRMQEGG